MRCRHRRRRTVFSQGVFWLLLGGIFVVSWLLAMVSG